MWTFITFQPLLTLYNFVHNKLLDITGHIKITVLLMNFVFLTFENNSSIESH